MQLYFSLDRVQDDLVALGLPEVVSASFEYYSLKPFNEERLPREISFQKALERVAFLWPMADVGHIVHVEQSVTFKYGMQTWHTVIHVDMYTLKNKPFVPGGIGPKQKDEAWPRVDAQHGTN